MSTTTATVTPLASGHMNQDRPRMAVVVPGDMMPSITPELLKEYENSDIEVRGVDVADASTCLTITPSAGSQWRLDEMQNRCGGKRTAQWKREQGKVGRNRGR